MLVPESREWGWERRKNDVRYVSRIRIELGREEVFEARMECKRDGTSNEDREETATWLVMNKDGDIEKTG